MAEGSFKYTFVDQEVLNLNKVMDYIHTVMDTQDILEMDIDSNHSHQLMKEMRLS